jgi:catechol 2,3-dioxygenase-like lactoylglutathione lyase family enzyme
MKKQTFILALVLLVVSSCTEQTDTKLESETGSKEETVATPIAPEQTISSVDHSGSLGAFSMSLNVKDLSVSKKFYEDLGFTVLGGGMEMNYLIMKNGNALIGLFQGMFEGNIITFNPGWNESGKDVENFTDIREIQKGFLDKGITIDMPADTNTTGPASIILTDPDGNTILIDQHR